MLIKFCLNANKVVVIRFDYSYCFIPQLRAESLTQLT